MRSHIIRLFRSRQTILIGVLICTALFALSFFFPAKSAGFQSVEYKFTDASDKGLAITPASCPSYPHGAGDCGDGGYSQGSYGGYSQGGYYGQTSYYSQTGYYSQTSYYAEASYNTCTATYFCTGPDLYYRTASCAESFVAHCTYGCSGGACLPPPPPTGTITARPSLVPEGDTVEITWSSEHTTSCTVRGNNGTATQPGDSWTGINGNKTSKHIYAQTTFTLRCTGIDGSTLVKTVIVNIIPRENET